MKITLITSAIKDCGDDKYYEKMNKKYYQVNV